MCVNTYEIFIKIDFIFTTNLKQILPLKFINGLCVNNLGP